MSHHVGWAVPTRLFSRSTHMLAIPKCLDINDLPAEADQTLAEMANRLFQGIQLAVV
jgi:hypothetical protein